MLGFLATDKAIVSVNNDPRVASAREHTRAAMATVAAEEATEQYLRDVLDPRSDSSTTTVKDITPEMIDEANTRLIPRRFGVTNPRYADTMEGNAARAALKAAQAEEAVIRDAVQKELEQQVRDRVRDLIEELADVFKPVQQRASDLLALAEESGLTVPQVHSCLPFSSVANEITAVKDWAKH